MSEENWRVTLFKMINDFHLEREISDIEIMEALATLIMTIGHFSEMPPGIFKRFMNDAAAKYHEDYRKRSQE